MLRRMYAVLTAEEPQAPRVYWPYDSILLSQRDIQHLAGSVNMTLVGVVSIDHVPEEDK